MNPASGRACASGVLPAKSRCVLLFSRRPVREGREKGLGNSTDVFALARRRVVRAVEGLGDADLIVVGAPQRGVRGLLQRGGDFGARIENALLDARALGYGEILVVPGDVPGIDAASLREAFRALEGAGMVLGPSPDGGIWLLGVGPKAAIRFARARWQSKDLREDLRAACSSAVILRRSLRDLDGAGDLVPLSIAAAGDGELLRALDAVVPAPSAPGVFARSAQSRIVRAVSASPRAPPAVPTLAA